MAHAVKFNTSNKTIIINDENYDISSGRIFVIGGGKASGLMAETLEKILGPEHITNGFVNCTSKAYKTSKIRDN